MAAGVAGVRSSLEQSDELIAETDEGVGLTTAEQIEVKQLAVEFERLVDIADFERYMIDTDGTLAMIIHGVIFRA